MPNSVDHLLSSTASPPPITPITVTIAEACAALGISRARLYRMINAGEIKTVAYASRRLILRAELQRFISDAIANSVTPSVGPLRGPRVAALNAVSGA